MSVHCTGCLTLFFWLPHLPVLKCVALYFRIDSQICVFKNIVDRCVCVLNVALGMLHPSSPTSSSAMVWLVWGWLCVVCLYVCALYCANSVAYQPYTEAIDSTVVCSSSCLTHTHTHPSHVRRRKGANVCVSLREWARVTIGFPLGVKETTVVCWWTTGRRIAYNKEAPSWTREETQISRFWRFGLTDGNHALPCCTWGGNDGKIVKANYYCIFYRFLICLWYNSSVWQTIGETFTE